MSVEPVHSRATNPPSSLASNTARVVSSDQNVPTLSCVRDINNISNELIIESGLSALGPPWPVEFNSESLISVLLTRQSNISLRLKMHTCSVHKFMEFLNEVAPSIPAGMVDAYDKLKHDLIQLRTS